MIEWHWVEQEGLPTEPDTYLVACTDRDEVAQLELGQNGDKGLAWIEFDWAVDEKTIYAWARNPHMPPTEPSVRVTFGPVTTPDQPSYPPVWDIAASRYFLGKL